MVTARRTYVILLTFGIVLASGGLSLPAALAQDTAQPKAQETPQPKAQDAPQPQPKPVPKAQPKRAPAAGEPAAPVAAEPPAKPEPPAGCAWIGKRVIQSLLRDDAVTAQDFDRLYRTFDCSGEHLRVAFDCTVADGAPQTANEAQTRLDGCWNDPKFDFKSQKVQSPAASTPTTTTPGTSTSQPKGPATGKAAPAAPAAATPNYPKGK